MKRTVTVMLLISILLGAAIAQEATKPAKIAVSFNPLGLVVCSFPFSGEYAITDNLSVAADVLYSPNIAWVSNISLFDINAGARYYFGSMLGNGMPIWTQGPALRGLFGGARLAYLGMTWNYDIGSSQYKGTMSSLGLGAEVGDKYFFKETKGLYLEGTLGFIYFFPAKWSWTIDGNSYTWLVEPSATYKASGVTYGLKLGYAF